MPNETRTTLRYFLVSPLPGLAGNTPVEIIDLSDRGARLALTTAIPAGTRMTMTVGHRGRTMTAKATVLWCQIDALLLGGNIDRYLSGVVLDEPLLGGVLLPELIESGAAIPIVDGRNEDRYHLTVPLSGSYGPLPMVNILDLSLGGACVSISQRLPEGARGRLRFQVDAEIGAVDVEATVAWCRAVEGSAGLRAGARIEGGGEQMRRVIDRLCLRDEARINLDSLRKKFDALRAASLKARNAISV